MTPLGSPGGILLVILDGDGEPDELVDRAARQAQRLGARIQILTVPASVPFTAAWSGWMLSSGYGVAQLRQEAVERAARLSCRAAKLVAPTVPTEHEVVLGSLRGALGRATQEPRVSHLFVNPCVLRRNLRTRWFLRRRRDQEIEFVSRSESQVLYSRKNR